MPPYGKIKPNFFYKYLSEVNQKLDRRDLWLGKENGKCMKRSHVVTIFLNNSRLVHRNKSSNEALIAKRIVCPDKLLKEHIGKFGLSNELGLYNSSSCFRTLSRL